MSKHWFSKTAIERLPQSTTLLDWLFYRDSMTKRLEAYCGTDIMVEVLCQKWQCPNVDELELLNLPVGSPCLIREVKLHGAGRLLMLARSVLPEGPLTEAYQQSPDLQKTALGKWLFEDPHLTRSEFLFAELKTPDAFYQWAVDNLGFRPDHLWARRSLLSAKQQKLLLTEIFMPEFYDN